MRLIRYRVAASLDGYIAGPKGEYDWIVPDPDRDDIRLQINQKAAYIETRLNYRLPVVVDESWILVVNVHER